MAVPRAQINEVDQTYRAAYMDLATRAMRDALAAWTAVTLAELYRTPAAAWWQLVSTMTSHRFAFRNLAIARYRLLRALELGRTVALPSEKATSVKLADLWRQFYRSADQPGRPIPRGGRKTIPIDKTVWDRWRPDKMERTLAASYFSRGPARLKRKVERWEKQGKARIVDGELQVSKEAGPEANRVKNAIIRSSAANAARIAQDGARDATAEAIERDKKVKRWFRITDGDPCYWCAMLASQGAYYKSKRTAHRREDGHAYHDNCNCDVRPSWIDDGHPLANIPAAERRWVDLWQRFDKERKDTPSLTWRKWFNNQLRKAR
ncbi:hypothetical protein [Haloglycomyces albus]|uniref:VG15 protein n=1 Tax=Haloglycomyces albus TaxID=526067 RepID=UPI0004B91D36|nr:hypothetical protein [Haloglycomyces albus]